MSLRTYKKKRDFKVTKEPAPRSAPKSKISKVAKRKSLGGKAKSLEFVIHEHDASHHHFDLRLEHRGVLKSWAVPKTISLDPQIKRLAVEVEDHPFSYKDFQGEIPEGEYGGGWVKIWDSGKWINRSDQSIDLALKKGHLKFELSGKILKGQFHLVRTKKSSQWLLFASQSQEAETLPRPQLCLSATKVSLPCILEPKLDGYRFIAIKDAVNVRLLTRNGLDWSDKFPKIVNSLQKIKLNSFILDGEIVAYSGTNLSFHDLQNQIELGQDKNFSYSIFDILSFENEMVTSLPLAERKNLLNTLSKKLIKPLSITPYLLINDEALLRSTLRKLESTGYEGAIVKNPEGSYLEGQRGDWSKLKWKSADEFVIVGYVTLKDQPNRVGALLLASEAKESLTYRGKVGTGFNDLQRKKLFKQLHTEVTSKDIVESAVKNLPDISFNPVTPQKFVQVSYQNITPKGHLRAPVYQGLREDKIYQLKRNISHPDKKYFKDGTSKLSVYNYYANVQNIILPFLNGQNVSLLRCPNGEFGKCFFQKKDKVKSTEKPILIESGTELMEWVQKSTIEFHISGLALKSHVNHLVFDLDPGPSVSYAQLKKTTLELNKILQHFKLPTFLKTSGRKGFHIMIPLKPGMTAKKLETFSKTIAEHLKNTSPELVSTTMSKSGREDKTFIDYFRNKKGATFVAPYSLRSHTEPTISAPLSWEAFKKSKSLPVITIHDPIDLTPFESYFDSAVDLSKFNQL